jgi:pyruvate dehydrogenase E1 component beta subunit
MPIVFRGPGGAALQLGAQHSQSFESWVANVPGLKVVMPATPADAKGLLKSAIRDGNPIVFIEGEMLYNMKGDVPDGEHIVPLGVAEVKREGKDVTIVAHAKMVGVALKAADELAKDGIQAEIVDPRTIRPLDVPTIAASVRKTNRCVIVEEGWPFAGVGAQFAYDIQREAFDYLDAPIVRVTAADVPMPYNKQLEKLAKPDTAKVVQACRQVLYLG